MTTIKGPGNLGGTVSVSENHVNYESRDDAVYLNIDGRNRYDGTKFFTLSVENARELAAELTKIADRFDLNKPKPIDRLAYIKSLPIGTVYTIAEPGNGREVRVRVPGGYYNPASGRTATWDVAWTKAPGTIDDIEILFDPNGGK